MQYVLPPGSVVFTGCVGDDELAEQLKAANKREGLDQVYLVKKGEKTVVVLRYLGPKGGPGAFVLTLAAPLANLASYI